MVSISASTKLWAFAMAEQFESRGLLDELITTYAYSKNTIARRFIRRTDREKIPPEKIRTNIYLAVLIGKFRSFPHIWNDVFDRWAATKLQPGSGRVFIGWSGMSLHTIKRAKKLGMICILERGSSHILVQNKILQEEFDLYNKKFSIHPSVIKKELLEYQAADYISVPSSFVRNSFISQGVSETKIFVNPFGAGQSFVRKIRPMRDAETKFTIVYMGTLSIRKGLLYFFRALEILNIPVAEYDVLFLGSVESEIQSTIEKYRKPNWKFMGHVDHYSLPDWLAKCDIGVQPSLEEGLSMVIPQMMACGVPVIVTPNTGGENIIQNNLNGFVVPVRDPQAIADKLEWAYSNPRELQDMKKNVAESILSDFTWEAYGERYSRFLKTIMQKKTVASA